MTNKLKTKAPKEASIQHSATMLVFRRASNKLNKKHNLISNNKIN
jgi:hypothetical protein